jgi:cytochrome P450
VHKGGGVDGLVSHPAGGGHDICALLAQAPGAVPILGHALPILYDPLRFLRTLPPCGDLVEIRVGPVKAIVVCDPNLTRQILIEDRVFDKGGPLFDRAREIAGNGLITCPYRDHRRQRRLLQPAFHHSRFPGYTQAMLREITAVTGSWRDGQAIDVLSETMKIGTRVLLALMLGSTLSSATLDETIGHVSTWVTYLYQSMFLRPPLDRLPLPSIRRFAHANNSLRTILTRLIQDRRADRTDHADLLSLVLTSPDTGNGPACARNDDLALSDAEIIDQLITFFVAGTESTGMTLAWALDLLARHPDIQQRLQAETDALSPGPVRFDDLPALALTHQVVTETLRMYPPVWFLTRKTTSDSRLGAHPVPAGTTFIFSPYLIHHRPDLYPDPDRFDPDRWTTTRTSPRDAFIPFGGGARTCIGDIFALTEIALALATITAHWHLQPSTDHPPRPVRGIGLSPQRFTLHVTSRHPGAHGVRTG